MQRKTSIEGQILICRQIAERLGLIVVAIYTDSAESGHFERRRDGYQDLLAAARRKEFDFVIVEMWNRLSRNPATISRLWQMFDFNNVKMVDQRGVPATETDISIASLYNTIYKPQLADFVRRGHRLAVSKGKFPGRAPFGYRKVEGDKGRIEPDPDRVKIVLRMMREYAAGRSTREICADLTSDGITPPGGGKVWSHNALVSGQHGLLSNPIYIGEIRWNTHTTAFDPETEMGQRRKTPEETHLIERREELRIVPQDLWDAVQAIRASRAAKTFGPSGKPRRRIAIGRNNEHPLSGVLHCARCKGPMRIATTSPNGSPRAACANADQRNTCEHTRSFDMDTLLRDVADQIRERLSTPRAAQAALEAFRELRREKHKKEDERTRLEKAKRVLTTDIERLSHAITQSRRKPDELLRLIDEKDVERENIQAQLDNLGDAAGDDNVVPFNFSDLFCGEVRRLVDELATSPKAIETRLAFRALVGRVTVFETPKRAPYRIETALNRGAFGMRLFAGKRRKPAEIAASASWDKVNLENTVLTLSQKSNKLISLGEWQRAA
jgi:DNA invertase Pin-like site-specific DNA recombinase